MKTLRNYIDEAQTKAFQENGAFFAFSNEQFEKAKNPAIEEYISLGAGLICPKENAKKLISQLDQIAKEGIAQDIAENGKEAIIKRELANYECYYTGDISDCVEALEDYGYTKEDIAAIFYGKNQETNN